MTIKPFHFKLKKISGSLLALEKALFSFLPKKGLRTSFPKIIAEALEKHIGAAVPFALEAVHETTFREFQRGLPEPLVVASVGLLPSQEKMFIDIDPTTALMVIEKMLGGKAETPIQLRPLSEIEQGVLQYLLLQLMTHIRLMSKTAPLHFRFERFFFSERDLEDLVSPDETMFALTFRLHMGANVGFIRLCIPKSFVQQHFASLQEMQPLSPEEHGYFLERARQFDYVRFPIWAEAGRTTLKVEDLNTLELGDVILLDQSDIILENGQPQGQALLMCGVGEHTAIVTDLAVQERKAHCRLVAVTKGEI